MRVQVVSRPVDEIRADLLVIPITSSKEGAATLPRRLSGVDGALDGRLADALASSPFRGRAGQTAAVYGKKSAATPRVLLIGAGDGAKIDVERLRRIAGSAASHAREHGLSNVAIWVPPVRRMSAAESAVALTEGACLGAYRYDAYKRKADAKKSARKSPTRVQLLYAENAKGLAEARRAVGEALIGAECQNVARDLSNAPPNELTPVALARHARRVAREAGLTCRVMDVAEMERRGMGAILAVGQGSANPPRMIVLEHRGGRKSGPVIGLVGKGITFDTGGISIKPSPAMDQMKHDMSGAAALIGTMRAIALLKLPIHVVGIVAAAENMPSGHAYRPGDIIEASNGKTIEVLNTDAEGRLVMADALHHLASTWKPAALVDMATLTGAAMIAFGPWATAALGNDDSLVEEIRAAGDEAGELIWPMPLLEEHKRAMDSRVADLKNTGGRDAGVSTAGAFLAAFVGETPWVHLDMAGSAFHDANGPYHRGGATGVGVRSLVAWVRTRASKKR